MQKQLSIIIVTYNSEKLIFDCLDSIFRYNDIGDELEIIIVDNCSVNCDIMFEMIREKYPSVILKKSLVNGGYGHGNNQGINIASAPRLIVMNPDVRLVNPIFEKIIDKFNSNENVGLMGVRFVDGSNHVYFKLDHCNLVRLIFNRFLLKFGFYKLYQVFFSGSFLVLDKKSFVEIGMFDERFFMYCEEADVSNRMLSHGKDTILSDDLYVLHLAHGREVNHKLLKIGDESRKYYCEKYGIDLHRYYRGLLVVLTIKYLGAVVLRNNNKKEEFKARIQMCKNWV